jgi:hypothetical protein
MVLLKPEDIMQLVELAAQYRCQQGNVAKQVGQSSDAAIAKSK